MIKGWPAILLAFVSSVAITWYYLPKVLKVVNERHLLDKPGKHKIHKKEIPTLGGIGIFAGFIFGFLMGVNGYMPYVSYFTAAALLLFFIGVKDDLVYINPWKKLAAEIATGVIIALFTDIHFSSLHGFLGIQHLPEWAFYLITVLIIVLIINAYNLIDGIDGLAASIGIIATIFFGVWFFLSGDYGYTIMAAALLGALIIFLGYNITDGPKKIFMGDTGSLVIGFTMAVFAIRFNELDAAGRSFIDLESTPSVSIAVLIVPLYDTLRVIILRMRNHQSFFVADNRHVHHMMLRAGLTHRQSTLYISLFNILMIALALLLDGIGILWLGLVLLVICGVASTVISEIVKRKETLPATAVKVPD
ncbi:MAG: MraY family glycosyltransferase [Bacteroidales bacterium]|nr:MraY family glycosyltransferase [Bacteroidales bacterium]